MDKIGLAMLCSYITMIIHRGNLCLSCIDVSEIEKICQPIKPEPARADNKLLCEMMDALRDNKFIEAIKAHRMLTGLPLKESKDQVEAWRNWFPVKAD